MRVSKSIKGEKYYFYAKAENKKPFVRLCVTEKWHEAVLLGNKLCLLEPIVIFREGNYENVTSVHLHKQALNYFEEVLPKNTLTNGTDIE